MVEYRELPLNERPKTLEPNEYFNVSLQKRKAEEARMALRANLKRQYQMQLNNPHRTQHIEDPAHNQWTYARTNPYPNFKVTPKTSMLGIVFGIAPLFGIYYMLTWNRAKKEEKIKNGTYAQKYRMGW